MTTQPAIIELPGLIIDTANVIAKITERGTERLAGKVTITIVDPVDDTRRVVTANYAGATADDAVMLCDFEGEEDDEALYYACELFAPDWAAAIDAWVH